MNGTALSCLPMRPLQKLACFLSALALAGFAPPNALAEILYLTNGSTITTVDTAALATPTGVTVTGMEATETLVGIDERPATGFLYGVGSLNHVYIIDPITGAATQLNATPFTPALTGTAFGTDFNPAVDRIRQVSNTEQNLRISPNNGTVANNNNDTPLSPGNIVAVAYDRNDSDVATPTTLYGIDSASGMLVRIGGVDGNPSPNLGAVTNIGSLGLGINLNEAIGFDISPSGTAYASITTGGLSRLYTINLLTGMATLAANNGGTIGTGATSFLGLAADAATPPFAVLNTNDSGPNSLRDAITAANSTPGVQTIIFAIPGAGPHTIDPASPLPAITDPVIIDGTTQPGYDAAAGLPVIELNGAGAGAGADGLVINAGSTTIRALAINRFADDGIEINTNGNNFIAACFIGTNQAGTAASPNGGSGIVINNAPGNLIGGTVTGFRNLISSNAVHGVEINGASATGNRIEGNYIGTDITGSADLGNGNGVVITSANNKVGGATNSAGNLISGNTANVAFSGPGATGNTVEGNIIGLNAPGTTAIPSGIGVRIDGAPNNIIGGTTAAARNIIAGHTSTGVLIGIFTAVPGAAANGNQVLGNYIGLNAAGTAAVPNLTGVDITNCSDNIIGGTAPGAGNIISGNLNGVYIDINTGGTATGNRVEGNFIGTNATGTASIPNTNYPVRIDGGSNNVIGGTASGARNIISGNSVNNARGVLLLGPNTISNRVEGNYIGLDVNGAALPNATGVDIQQGATNNIVGGTTPGARNIISGNTTRGIVLLSTGTTGNQIQGNYIGTNTAGTGAIPNDEGVLIEGPTGNVIGGSAAGAGNVISGNVNNGVFIRTGGNTVQGNIIGLNAAGTAAVANGLDGVEVEGVPDTVIGGTAPGARNIISGNSFSGIRITGAGATNTTVQGNIIGLNAAGTTNWGNGVNGVRVDNAPDNIIGGTAPGARNIISGNPSGVTIRNSGATGNQIQGNYIGTDVNGTAELGNLDGVVIQDAPNNVVGGTTVEARNVISGNGGNGVLITGAPSTGNQIQGNFIGTDVNGTADLGNVADGVNISSPGNTVGGTSVQARNIISGNGNGVVLGDNGNVVQGNYIGTDVNGTADLGNTFAGVAIRISSSNTIGGTTSGARNVISGNGTDGVLISGSIASSNVVQGNFIGTAANGASPLGNTGKGVFIDSAPSNTIGGTAVGAANLIEFNNNGVAVLGNISGFANTITSNSIHSNVLLGIDLGNDGVTPNDSNDGDSGANGLQNFPVLTSVVSAGGTTTINGSLNSMPTTSYMLQFFSNDIPDGSGNGEGQFFFGQATVMTDGSGNATFSAAFPGTLFNNQTVTATATANEGTSEFSANALVAGPPQPTPTPTPTPTPSPSPASTPTPTPTPSPGGTASPTPTPGASATPTPTPGVPAQPLNISTRLRVQTGEKVLIGGFIITGNAPKKITVRGMGPSLTNSGISDVLLDPVIELYGPDGTQLDVNDNWKDDPDQAEIAAAGLAPQNDSEAAFSATLPPEGYTVVLRGQNDTTGVGLIEIYDREPGANSALANISTRGFVETGNNVMIGGFILGGGGGGTRIAVRGLGPSLSDDGVNEVLDDPTLDLYDSNGTKLVSNDDWMDNPAQAVQLTINGLALPNNRESGIFTTLPPGAFTAILSGKNGGTGVGLIEIYNLD